MTIHRMYVRFKLKAAWDNFLCAHFAKDRYTFQGVSAHILRGQIPNHNGTYYFLLVIPFQP